ncbi:hypothetical protein [Bathymodiolus thermophilus thioautotrophic gill symbiont]|uniref:hypothetical protein n=1 Tax=Bathymodiolus thermophilus thioautotrophic gill symbiont TaxID=2360 RepID=UPI0011607A4D|nr:hypothetical protein [Bathymodiolus thermophilus thioautotrophic gill symbiont]
MSDNRHLHLSAIWQTKIIKNKKCFSSSICSGKQMADNENKKMSKIENTKFNVTLIKPFY